MIAIILFLYLCAYGNAMSQELSGVEPLALLPVLAASNLDTPETISLGKTLFFDPMLSGNNQVSCATCHDPKYGWGDGEIRSIGVTGVVLSRHTPSLFNTAYQTRWFWDGRAKSLESQILGPIQNKDEMGQDLGELVEELENSPLYVAMFTKSFGTATINVARLSAALAAFERTLLSNQSAFDAYLRGDQNALTHAEKRGLALFKGKARCILCHHGSNFSDRGFHRIGLARVKGLDMDEGHFSVIPIASQKGSFKTPSLRSVALHPPYMHHGGLATLQDVISFYNRGGDVAKNRDPQIQPLSLSQQEKKDLIAFLHSLTSQVVY